LFRALPPADFGDTDAASEQALHDLGAAMVSPEDKADPKDGPDAEESGIPAAFTYFGQFIDHDLTFDPASSLQRQDDPDALIDFRTPRFDLDSVYGRGPDDQPYLYSDGGRFVVGDELSGQALTNELTAHDLPRSAADPARAIIGDPRNDENVIVSQLQGLMLRLHNRLADGQPELSFEAVQRELRFHYQWVVIEDFLPTIISEAVLGEILPHRVNGTDLKRNKPKLKFYNPQNSSFMPLEFSAAAYRFGHSMVRPGYRLNDAIGPLPIFPVADKPELQALTGFGRFPNEWGIDWGRFIDLEPRPFGDENDPNDPDNARRLQLAYKIDTSIVDPLGNLPRPRVVSDPPQSLAHRNLLRGWRMRLPTGQDVARMMGVEVMADADIRIGNFTNDGTDIKGDIVNVAGDVFKGNCPLWTYVLAETEAVRTPVRVESGERTIITRRLGPVGGRIVAETIVGILVGDSSSFLNANPLWRPSLAVNGQFGLRELILAAL
jgi:Animal haem peroxidase